MIYTQIIFENRTYTLTDNAVFDNTYDHNGDALYHAYAVDEAGKDYLIKWLKIEEPCAEDDDSNCCDWENPTSVTPR